MGAVVGPALYVPNPPVDTPWVGKPKGVALVLLAALTVVAPFAAPSQSARTTYTPDQYWQWTPPNRYVLALAASAVARPSVYVPSPPVDTFWAGAPKGASLVLLAPSNVVSPFAPSQTAQRTTVPPDQYWQWTIPSRAVLPSGTALPVTGFHIQDVPEEPTGWVSGSKKSPLVLTLVPPTVLPFSNPRHFETQPETGWVGRGSPVPAVLQIAVTPPFTVHGTRQFNVYDPPDWTGSSKSCLYLLTLPPTIPPFSAVKWQFGTAEETSTPIVGKSSFTVFHPPTPPVFTASPRVVVPPNIPRRLTTQPYSRSVNVENPPRE